jgi:hypothetical protein
MFIDGVFVRCLESEYLEVRIATLHSIKRLLQYVERVGPIVKILLELVNDEYLEVRVIVLEML